MIAEDTNFIPQGIERALLEGVSGQRVAAATAPSKGLFLVRVEYPA